MNTQQLFDSIQLSEEIAMENFQQRNKLHFLTGRLDGVCEHFFPSKICYPLDICLRTKVSQTVKGQFRYTFEINGKRIAKKLIPSEFQKLGALEL
jgi:hypothetical protein